MIRIAPLFLLAFAFSSSALAAKVLTLEEAIRGEDTNVFDSERIKLQATIDSAKAYGICLGNRFEQKQINDELDAKSASLDAIYNFSALLIHADTPGSPGGSNPEVVEKITTDGAVLPPVLTKMTEVYDQHDSSLIRIYDETYRIVENARLVYAPPNWRTYLYIDIPEQGCIKPPILVNAKDEWEKAVREGWELGIRQARANMRVNFDRLKRDFEGRVLYHVLLRRGMVTLPILATSRREISGGANEMNINERVYRITATAKFEYDNKKWLPTARQMRKND